MAEGNAMQPPPLSEKERALQERLDKRGALIAGAMRKFMTAYWSGRQKMMDDSKAAELAKKLGKKKRRPKKAASKKPAGGDKKKKPSKNPVQEAWSAFLLDLEDRINKQKRCTLEDIYRGVSKLSQEEQRSLACIVAASNNKKVLPTEGMNINSLNIREAVFSAVSSFDMPVEKAIVSASSGLALVTQRGASEEQLLRYGFKEQDLLRVGCSREEVIALALHAPANLHASGVAAFELVEPAASGGPLGGLLLAPMHAGQHLSGYQGASKLKAAGYSAAEIFSTTVYTAWDLKQAGFSLAELQQAGLPPEAIIEAGFAEPQNQPASFLAASFNDVCGVDVPSLPAYGEGTTARRWQVLLASERPTLATEKPTQAKEANASFRRRDDSIRRRESISH